MLNLEVQKFKCTVPFQMHLLGDRGVRDLLHKFDFYNVKFIMSEHKHDEVSLQFPSGNLYWYIDFEREVFEMLKKSGTFRKEWKALLKILKAKVYTGFTSFKSYIQEHLRRTVPDTIDRYKFYGDRAYQAYDVESLVAKMSYNWQKCRAGLILSEQRTGKTRVALAAAERLIPWGGTVIIVAPKSAGVGWVKDATELNSIIGTESYSVTIVKHASQCTESKALDSVATALNVRVLTFELFRTLTEKQQLRLISPHSKSVLLIGDEVHRLRKFKSKQSQTLYNFKCACLKHKYELSIIGVTGTPAVKHSSDIFGLLSLINTSKIALDPYWKNWDCFCDYFYNCYDSEFGKQVLTARRDSELNFIMQCVAVQTKQANLKLFEGYDLKYLKYELEMDEEQKLAYDELVSKMQYEEVDCKNSLAQLVRLQQTCVDPSALLASYEALAPKLQKTMYFITKSKSQGIIMSKYLHPLELLGKELSKAKIGYEILNGAVSMSERNRIQQRFNEDPSCKVLLIQLQVGKESLTLPAAGYTVFLDRMYTPGDNAQAEMRMSPVDGKACTKYIIDLVMKHTVEERIHHIIVERKSAIHSVNNVFDFERKEEPVHD